MVHNWFESRLVIVAFILCQATTKNKMNNIYAEGGHNNIARHGGTKGQEHVTKKAILLPNSFFLKQKVIQSIQQKFKMMNNQCL